MVRTRFSLKLYLFESLKCTEPLVPLRVTGVLEPIPAGDRLEAGYALDGLPGLTYRQTTFYTHIHTYGQTLFIGCLNLCSFMQIKLFMLCNTQCNNCVYKTVTIYDICMIVRHKGCWTMKHKIFIFVFSGQKVITIQRCSTGDVCNCRNNIFLKHLSCNSRKTFRL